MDYVFPSFQSELKSVRLLVYFDTPSESIIRMRFCVSFGSKRRRAKHGSEASRAFKQASGGLAGVGFCK